MIKKAFLGKFSRSKLFSVITVIGIALIFALNLIITYVGREQTLLVDTSYEGLYTLTDLMKEECAFVDELDGNEKVKITFCADPDTLIASDITRVVYFMSLQLEKQFDRVEVDTVNVTYNPTAVSKYKPTTLSEILPTDVIISYGDRYRVASTNAFWTSSNGVIGSYFGEYKMASLIMSVTNINTPTAYFVIGHGETYYDAENPDRQENADAAYLYDMLLDRGLSTKTIDLDDVDEIPDDCVLLIINNPREDFSSDPDNYDRFDYVSETEKIDKYLVKEYGSVMIAKDYSLSLPNFEEFLYDWGFDTSSSLVKDEDSHITNVDNTFTTLIAEYDKFEDSYGYAIYGDFAALDSSPSMVFDNAGYIKCSYGEKFGTNEQGTYSVSRAYAPFFYTSSSAKAYEKNSFGEYVALEAEGKLHVAAVTTRLELDSYTGSYKYSYVFCVNSPDFFSNDHLGNASYANFEVMSALTENMVRSDEYASIDLGSTSMNSANRAGKVLLNTEISSQTEYDTDGSVIHYGLTVDAAVWYTVIIMLAPAAIGVVAIVVRIKRRFL